MQKINKTTILILESISELYKNKQDINPHSIAKKAQIDWRTAKRYMLNNFNIKEKNEL